MNLSWLPDAITIDVDVDVSVEIDDDLDIIGAAIEGYVNEQLSSHSSDSTDDERDPSYNRFGGV